MINQATSAIIATAFVFALLFFNRSTSNARTEGGNAAKIECVSLSRDIEIQRLQAEKDKETKRLQAAWAAEEKAKAAYEKLKEELETVAAKEPGYWNVSQPAILGCLLNKAIDIEHGREVRSCADTPTPMPDGFAPNH